MYLSIDLTPLPLRPDYKGLTPCQPATQAPAASLAPIAPTLVALPSNKDKTKDILNVAAQTKPVRLKYLFLLFTAS